MASPPDVEPAASPLSLSGELDPKVHLRQFERARAPVVCALGDSTFGDTGPDSVIGLQGLWPLLKDRFRQQNPTRSITFVNRSIACQTFATLDAVPALEQMDRPTWYDDPDRPWLDYVRDVDPDTLIVNFGINDQGIRFETLQSVLRKIASWSKVPDVILVTNKTMNSRITHPLIRPDCLQVGLRDAAMIRSLALSGGAIFGIDRIPELGLIDIGRAFSIAVEGLDPTRQVAERLIPEAVSLPEVPVEGSPYEFPETTGGDFSLTVKLTGDGRKLQEAGSVVLFGVGSSIGGHAIAVSANTVANHLGSCGAQLRSYAGWGDGDVRLTVEAVGHRLAVTLADGIVAEFLSPRGVSAFRPLVFVANVPAKLGFEILHFAGASPLRYRPRLSPDEAWGTWERRRFGGNGINHSSSLTVETVDSAVVGGLDLHCRSLPNGWACTPELRRRSGTLQQLWTDEGTGMSEWRELN